MIMSPIEPHSTSSARRWGNRAIDWIVPAQNLSRVVYGLITVGTLLAAESGLHDTYAEAVGSVVLALLLYWLAHAYSEVLGDRLATHRHLTMQALGRSLLQEWAIVRGATVPLLALLVAWAAGASQTTGVTVGVWATAASLLAFELLAGVRAKSSPVELLLEGCVGATMGLAIIALRAILH
jgi:hypothetical protein